MEEYEVDRFKKENNTLFRHFLNGIANVDHHQVADLNILMLQQEQTGIAFDATGFTAGRETVDFDHPHGYAQAHSLHLCVGASLARDLYHQLVAGKIPATNCREQGSLLHSC
jgi:hypothetical protein